MDSLLNPDEYDPYDCPEVPLELVVHLEASFPCPKPIPGDPLDKLMFESGKASVAGYLRAQYQKQNSPQE